MSEMQDDLRDDGFAAAMRAVESIPGWLTDGQARMLYDAAGRLGPGQRIVEIGSHRGRSTIVFALAARPDVEIVAIDPFARAERVDDVSMTDAEVGERDFEIFWGNLRDAGVDARVTHVRRTSADALEAVTGSVDLLYVDGAHDYASAVSDIRSWGSRVETGGTMLVHDAYSSVGVTAAQAVELFLSSRYRYVGRSRSLAEYRRTRVRGLARIANAVRQLAPLPWFARNVLVKVAIARKVPVFARVLGHEGTDYPY
jgi:predicted O-methyltransferase YrrM